MNKANSFCRLISAFLIFSQFFMFTGCYTTNNVYETREDEIITVTVLTFIGIEIVSHQNNMGVLYYTVDGKYLNSTTGLFEYRGGNNFPFSTYSDALLYKNENVKEEDFEKEIITTHAKTEKKRELIGRKN